MPIQLTSHTLCSRSWVHHNKLVHQNKQVHQIKQVHQEDDEDTEDKDLPHIASATRPKIAPTHVQNEQLSLIRSNRQGKSTKAIV